MGRASAHCIIADRSLEWFNTTFTSSHCLLRDYSYLRSPSIFFYPWIIRINTSTCLTSYFFLNFFHFTSLPLLAPLTAPPDCEQSLGVRISSSLHLTTALSVTHALADLAAARTPTQEYGQQREMVSSSTALSVCLAVIDRSEL